MGRFNVTQKRRPSWAGAVTSTTSGSGPGGQVLSERQPVRAPAHRDARLRRRRAHLQADRGGLDGGRRQAPPAARPPPVQAAARSLPGRPPPDRSNVTTATATATAATRRAGRARGSLRRGHRTGRCRGRSARPSPDGRIPLCRDGSTETVWTGCDQDRDTSPSIGLPTRPRRRARRLALNPAISLPISRMLAKRSAGLLDSARSTHRPDALGDLLCARSRAADRRTICVSSGCKRRARERRAAREHLVHDHAERIDVDARVDRSGSEICSGAMNSGVPIVRPRRVLGLESRRRQELRDPEVEHLDVIGSPFRRWRGRCFPTSGRGGSRRARARRRARRRSAVAMRAARRIGRGPSFAISSARVCPSRYSSTRYGTRPAKLPEVRRRDDVRDGRTSPPRGPR